MKNSDNLNEITSDNARPIEGESKSAFDPNEMEKVFSEIENEEKTENHSKDEPKRPVFDTQKMVLMGEDIVNRYLDRIHKDLSFTQDEIKMHSEALTFWLEESFDLEQLKKSPGYFVAGMTGLMLLEKWKVYNDLVDRGEIGKKKKEGSKND